MRKYERRKSTVACDLTNLVFGKRVAELHDAYLERELEVLQSGIRGVGGGVAWTVEQGGGIHG